jgi:hypothetical protein
METFHCAAFHSLAERARDNRHFPVSAQLVTHVTRAKIKDVPQLPSPFCRPDRRDLTPERARGAAPVAAAREPAVRGQVDALCVLHLHPKGHQMKANVIRLYAKYPVANLGTADLRHERECLMKAAAGCGISDCETERFLAINRELVARGEKAV